MIHLTGGEFIPRLKARKMRTERGTCYILKQHKPENAAYNKSDYIFNA
jgi:hypothetical protein